MYIQGSLGNVVSQAGIITFSKVGQTNSSLCCHSENQVTAEAEGKGSGAYVQRLSSNRRDSVASERGCDVAQFGGVGQEREDDH